MTRNCFNYDSRKPMTRFEDETFEIERARLRAIVKGLSGWRCQTCDEVEFDPDSAHRYGKRETHSCSRRANSKAKRCSGFGRCLG